MKLHLEQSFLDDPTVFGSSSAEESCKGTHAYWYTLDPFEKGGTPGWICMLQVLPWTYIVQQLTKQAYCICIVVLKKVLAVII